MRFGAILDLALRHTYYADGRCTDFAVEPSAETRRLLANHRAVLRFRRDGVRVLAAIDGDGGLFLPFAPDAVLCFQLELRNDDFALFTDLAGVNEMAAPLFTNAGAADEAGGELRLTSWGARERPARRPLADVEIRPGLAGAGEDAVAREFHVTFHARLSRWAYYCVTDLAPAETDRRGSGELTIVDAVRNGAEAPLVFSESNRRELDLEPDDADRIAVQLADLFPDRRRVRFVSDEAVVMRQEPRKHLELRLAGERLLGPLPNPSIRNHSRLEPALAGGFEQHDSLFQVVEYLTQPFP